MRSTLSSSRRIVVVGTSCSGKTSFARDLAQALGIAHIELDSLFWGPNWAEPSAEVFQEKVERAIEASEWVVDGNYASVRDAIWRSADTAIWLDYSFPVVFGRALARTLKRTIIHEELWSGNRESLRKAFFSKESILLWVLKTYRARRREFPGLFSRKEYRHLKVFRFQSPWETESYLRAAGPT